MKTFKDLNFKPHPMGMGIQALEVMKQVQKLKKRV